ncbi:MAG: phosphoglycerate kinase [Nitrososphaeraceae archaeon]|jgi:phosphoglycerate kinase|nr:phosphoglycerate kinase [Nitrososphaeraceae archaeon]MDW0171987.1 phosphoglycerate kinase [Nitrososphaeraceae archaeon]MDW0173864.1 phosphoglycerate kinase [Nitrososphaeraceae archaeon]MDW0175756.1 phosphoglycerate kinase [Nitrososphaeraceae archaeon]MDW0181083.1 phosphoglycerate kinase [Nitrososphaeraceae archaeon]
MLRSISDLDDIQYYGKKVLVRVDFNITINNGAVTEDYRIRSAIPTIEYLIKRGAKVILASHLGRPKFRDHNNTLAPVAVRLKEILNRNVDFIDDCIGPEVQAKIDKLNYGSILLLENLRYYSEEQDNDPEFSKSISSLADIYVNDAFSTSHRKHASTYGAVKNFEIRLSGFSLKKEIEYLSMIRYNPKKPFTLVIGGSKIKDKIGALENLLPKADKLLIGGAAAYTFLKAKGFKIGNSLFDEEHYDWVKKALSSYGDKILLPVDHIVSSEENSFSTVTGDIPDGMSGFDIGNETSMMFSSEIGGNGFGTIFWNGPMGMFEVSQFSAGTMSVAKSMALAFWRGAMTLVGGGDSIAALKKSGVSENEVTHLSTGGGATLRFLAGDKMPGIEALERAN